MKIFFTASPRLLKTKSDILVEIYNQIEKLGHNNLSKLVIENNVEEFYNFDEKDRVKHFKTTLCHIKNADVVVIEASIHSLAMGYILEKSLNLSKQVILIYQKGNEPFFFSGINHENFQMIDYTIENIRPVLTEAFNYATTQQDMRFNLLISPSISNYLSEVSDKERISKASFIRDLIKQHMAKK
jgi:hypothetical protein